MSKTMCKLFASAALLFGAPALFAQTLVVPNQSGTINNAGQTFVINFTPGADSGGFDFTVAATPAANITITAVSATIPNGTATCSFNAPASSANCIVNANSNTVDLGAGSATVTYTGGATAGPVALNFTVANFFNQVGGSEPGTTTNGTLTLAAGPSGLALGYAPAAGSAIAVPASIGGTTVTSTINVTQTGGDTGQNTTLACTVSGTGYVATVTGSPFAPGGAGGSVGLACAGTAGAQTLTCTQTRSGTGGGAPIVSTWPLTCASAPGFTSVPPDDGTLTLVGIQGTSATASVAVTNPGTAPLTISGCAVTGTAFSLGTISSPIASGASGSIPVTCAVSPTAGTTLTGTLQCNTNAAAPRDVINYNLSCQSQSASIPTLGLGGKALMVLLMLGFGLVGFQLYRRSA
jgi:hypothetical protein